MKLTVLYVVLAIALGFAAGYWFGAGRGKATEVTGARENVEIIGRAAPSPVVAEDTAVPAGWTGAVPVRESDFKQKAEFLTTLAEKDPLAAIAWVKANSEEYERDDFYETIAAEWGKRDPRAAFDWAQSLAISGERKDAIRGLMKGAFEGGHEAAAMGLIGELPPGEYQDAAIVEAVSHLAVRDLEGAIAMVSEMGRTSSARSAGRRIAEEFLESGRFAEARLRVADLPYGNLRKQLTIGMAEELAEQDLPALLEWIKECPKGPEGGEIFDSSAMRSMGYQLGRALVNQGEPADAMAWVGALGDKRTQDYFAERLGEAWGSRSPEETSKWLLGAINEQGFASVGKISEGFFEEWVERDQNSPFEMIAGIKDPDDRSAAAFMALNELASENPRIAAERMVEWVAADPEKAPRLAARLMESWLRRDAEQASSWLNQQAAGPIKDKGIEQLVRSVLREDRDFETARAWLGEVQDSDTYERLAKEVEKLENPAKRGAVHGDGVFMQDGVLFRTKNGTIIGSGTP